MVEGQKPTVITLYITTFCPTSLKVFLVVVFCSISLGFGEAC
jgi:hypothetical protein